MQTHQPLRHRLGIVAHGIDGSRANAYMAIPDVETIQPGKRPEGAIADGARDGGRLELCDLGATIEHAGPVHTRLLLVDVQGVDHGLRPGTS